MQSPQKSEQFESRWGGPPTVLALVLVGAAALRLVGIRHGLPELLHPGEVDVVPGAWELTHGGGLDPHPYFDQPSLLLYLLAPFESWQEVPSYLTGRLVSVVAGLVGIAATWWLGQRSYGLVAGGVAAAIVGVAGVHVAYSRFGVADVLLTTLVTVALALLLSGRVEVAGGVAGLALAASWPGLLLAVPILVVGWGSWRRLAYAGGLGLATFVLASPFALVHPVEAAADVRRGLERAFKGEFAPLGAGDVLWDSLGPVLVVALVGLAVALVRRKREDVVLGSFALAYLLALLPVTMHFDGYVLPVVPVLAVLAARFTAFAPVTLLLLVVPFTWTVRDTKELTERDAATPRVELTQLQLPSGP